MKNPWKTLGSKIVHKNSHFALRQAEVIRPDGQKGQYNFIELPPSIFIVALTEKQELYLVGQYRYPTSLYSWEIPGGNSDSQPLLTAAKRELVEETGLEAKTWKKVGSFQSMNGICSEIAHVFIASDLVQTKGNEQKEEGISNIQKVPFKKALKMIKSGEITDGQSIAALTQAALYLENL